MNVLVTGGAGYVGAPTVTALEKAGHAVRVFDALMYDDLYLREVDFVWGNVLDARVLTPHLDWADAVVWLSALVGDPACAAMPSVAYKVNADAVRWLAENFTGRIVFPSTCSVYGHQDEMLNEDSRREPVSVYGQTKCDAEDYLQDLAQDRTVIYRLGTLFGLPGAFGRFRMDLVVNAMTVYACKRRHIEVHGGLQWRPFLHVLDAAAAMVVGLDGEPGVYNLVSENLQVRDLALLMAAMTPGLEVEWKESEKDIDPRNYRVLAERAAGSLGYTALRTVDEGIAEIADVVRSGRLARPDSPRFSNRAHQQLMWGR